ncbi:CRISPR-associated exonuclease Cas4/endonuclease Cas1 fusion [Mycolicibacterium hassiacum DSM 44199]|nr:CRISPR-associated endonuclease Cas1 [Mycolicibacterium hassiacum]VCT93049.1 CRISPR-associated exonuclease Cas4/endonuclease Cas1 fusion [Mycolicibacterium hassiacum DSM 44199]
MNETERGMPSTGAPSSSAIPEHIPARMLNEFVYCPRLFYLEWVDDRWADSADTEQGRFTHRASDRREGSLPDPEFAAILKNVSSVRIQSDRLGLVAVIDRVEGEDGYVCPVDIKKGRPDPDGLPWPADRVQALAQAALLKDAGYRVRKAVLYYAETHQRVDVPVTPEGLDEVTEIAARAREVACRPRPPLPLVHSPKCPRCSLLGLCLPDETNALLARDDLPVRTIVPRDPDHRPLYVTEQGAYVGVRSGRLRITKDREELAEVRLIDVAQLCVYGNVQVSTQALSELWARGTPVLWFSYGGWLRGWAQGEMSKYVELRRRQTAVHAQGGFDIARQLIVGKIKNSRTLLRRNARADVSAELAQLGRLAERAATADSASSLLGIEGAAARIYFSAFPRMIAPEFATAEFDTNGRKRRPAPDPINALLGFTYSLLLKDMVATCLGVGLDPYLGVYHRPRYGRPALALDLMEEFRPLIADSVVINALNNGEVSSTSFSRKGRAVWLTAQGRKAVMRAYERRLDTRVRHPIFKYQVTYRRVMDIQARIAAAVMVGEIEQYSPMTTR